ncbi:MAG: hypothetical protein ACQEXJ_24965 [Myxococcota bacterium]
MLPDLRDVPADGLRAHFLLEPDCDQNESHVLRQYELARKSIEPAGADDDSPFEDFCDARLELIVEALLAWWDKLERRLDEVTGRVRGEKPQEELLKKSLAGELRERAQDEGWADNTLRQMLRLMVERPRCSNRRARSGRIRRVGIYTCATKAPASNFQQMVRLDSDGQHLVVGTDVDVRSALLDALEGHLNVDRDQEWIPLNPTQETTGRALEALGDLLDGRSPPYA